MNAEFHDGIGIWPEAGKAVLFYNVLPDGNVDDWSVHGGEEVLNGQGEKWIANLWVWDPVMD
jgi:prolyl 4-hydroxylase